MFRFGLKIATSGARRFLHIYNNGSLSKQPPAFLSGGGLFRDGVPQYVHLERHQPGESDSPGPINIGSGHRAQHDQGEPEAEYIDPAVKQ